MAALVIVLVFSTFSTLTPDEGMMTGPPALTMRKTYTSYCFYYNQRKQQTTSEAVVNALEKWTFIPQLRLRWR
jgi:hypothetical protein